MGSFRHSARSLGARITPTFVAAAGVVSKIPSRLLTPRAVSHRVRKAVVETVEDRRLLSVSFDSTGFTVVTPAADTRIVYVSSSTGSDGNNGLSESSPVKSIAAGRALLRDGAGDHLLLKKGDAWNEGLGYWKISGKSADQPLLIGSYGSGARPEIRVGNSNAFGAGLPGTILHDVVIQGIRLYAAERDPNSPSYNPTANSDGVYIAGNVQNMLFEDVSVELFRNNMVVQSYYGPIGDFKVRLSNISNSYSYTSQHSQGLYLHGVDGILLEGNTIDHNGWHEQVAGARPTIFRHNVYAQGTSEHLVARHNIFSNAGSHGLQARIGGVVENNLFLNNPIGLSYGVVNGTGPLVPGGVTGTVRGNVFIGGRSIGKEPRGIGMEMANTRPGEGVLVEKNIFSGGYAEGVFAAINLTVGNNLNNSDEAVGLNDVTIRDNIVNDWYRALWVNPAMRWGGNDPKSVNNLKIENNDFQEIRSSNLVFHGIGYNSSQETVSGQRYQTKNLNGAPFYMNNVAYNLQEWKAAVEPTAQGVKATYADPTRNIETLSFALGGDGTAADFLAKARANDRDGFNPAFLGSAVTTYIRAGFSDASDTTPAIPQGYAFVSTPITGGSISYPGGTVGGGTTDPGNGGGNNGGGNNGGGNNGGGNNGGGETGGGPIDGGGSTGGGSNGGSGGETGGGLIDPGTGGGSTGGGSTSGGTTNPGTGGGSNGGGETGGGPIDPGTGGGTTNPGTGGGSTGGGANPGTGGGTVGGGNTGGGTTNPGTGGGPVGGGNTGGGTTNPGTGGGNAGGGTIDPGTGGGSNGGTANPGTGGGSTGGGATNPGTGGGTVGGGNTGGGTTNPGTGGGPVGGGNTGGGTTNPGTGGGTIPDGQASTPGVKTEIGSGGQLVVIWFDTVPVGGSTGGSTSGGKGGTAAGGPNPDVSYLDRKYPRIEFKDGYWFIVD